MLWFDRAVPSQPRFPRVELCLPKTFKVFPRSRGFQNSVKSGVPAYDFIILIASKCRASPGQVPIFRVLNPRINFPLVNWRPAVTSGVRISAPESLLTLPADSLHVQ